MEEGWVQSLGGGSKSLTNDHCPNDDPPLRDRVQCPLIVAGCNTLRINESNVVVQTLAPFIFAIANGESDHVTKALDKNIKKAAWDLFQEDILFSGACMDMAQGLYKALDDCNDAIFIFICCEPPPPACLLFTLP